MFEFQPAMRYLFALVIAALIGAGAHAEELYIDAGVTGNWFDPTEAGHGLQIEVLDLGEAVVAWYTFDTEGRPLWLFGLGEVSADTIRVELLRFEGTRFPPEFDPADVESTHWGEARFQLTGCDSATFEYTPDDEGYTPGSTTLARLTKIDGLRCAGSSDLDQAIAWNLNSSDQQFEALFLDYPDGEEAFFELVWGHDPLPGDWSVRSGVRISGNNHSDDLMMVLMRPLDGLAPATRYRIELEMQIATNVPSGCFGVGGSPGESVYLRMGASDEKPGFELVDSGVPGQPPMRRASIDLGQQANPGAHALAVGNMANGLDDSLCTDPDRPWRLKRVSTAGQPFEVTSDENGRIWVYGLSDSGFEATTTWYLTEFVVRLSPAD